MKTKHPPLPHAGWLQSRWVRKGVLGALLALSDCASPSRIPDPPIQCEQCADWNTPQQPFRIFGNTYYVGVQGLSAVLIDGGSQLLLIDGGLSQSAPLIAKNIEALGFSLKQVRWLVGSHTHYDHAGGLAALKRWTGAQVAASPRGAEAMQKGNVTADDPQAGFGTQAMAYPQVKTDRLLADGESIRVGSVAITGHYTPGHTPGGMSWSWRSCEGTSCLQMVYVDSLNPVSAPGFRYTQSPDRVATFRQSIAKVRNLPCDIVISAHPDFSSLFERWEDSLRTGSRQSFVRSTGCKDYADDAERRLDARLTEESR